MSTNKKSFKFIVSKKFGIFSVAFVLIVLATGFFYRGWSNSRFESMLRQVQAVEEKNFQLTKDLLTTENQLNAGFNAIFFDERFDYSKNKSHLNDIQRIIEQLTDEYVELCDGSDAFLTKEIVENGLSGKLLGAEERAFGEKLSALAEEFEASISEDCQEIDGIELYLRQTVLILEASNSIAKFAEDEFVDISQISNLEQFTEPLSTEERKLLESAFNDDFLEHIEVQRKALGAYYSASVAYLVELDELKGDRLFAEYEEFSSKAGLLDPWEASKSERRAEAQEDLDFQVEYFHAVEDFESSGLAEKYDVILGGTTNIYAILRSANDVYQIDNSDKAVIADSYAQLLKILEEKNYIESSLGISDENVSYRSKDGSEYTIQFENPFNGEKEELEHIL